MRGESARRFRHRRMEAWPYGAQRVGHASTDDDEREDAWRRSPSQRKRIDGPLVYQSSIADVVDDTKEEILSVTALIRSCQNKTMEEIVSVMLKQVVGLTAKVAEISKTVSAVERELRDSFLTESSPQSQEPSKYYPQFSTVFFNNLDPVYVSIDGNAAVDLCEFGRRFRPSLRANNWKRLAKFIGCILDAVFGDAAVNYSAAFLPTKFQQMPESISYQLRAACYVASGLEIPIADGKFIEVTRSHEMSAIDGAFYERAIMFFDESRRARSTGKKSRRQIKKEPSF